MIGTVLTVLAWVVGLAFLLGVLFIAYLLWLLDLLEDSDRDH